MQRAWIIGNGPSLNETPLDLLKGEVTFAMNKIHRIYDRTSWRPTYFWYVDYTTGEKTWRDPIDIHTALGIPMWLLNYYQYGIPVGHPNHDDLPEGVGDIPNVTWVPRCEKHHYYNAPNSKGMHAWHLPELCTAYSGLSAMIQLAVTLGYGPLYLLGCDLGYQGDYTKNHFDPDYCWDYRDRSEKDNANMIKLHQVARECSPVPIYNATIGGYLEVHPRVDMLEVLSGRTKKVKHNLRSHADDGSDGGGNAGAERKEVSVRTKRSVPRKGRGGSKGTE